MGVAKAVGTAVVIGLGVASKPADGPKPAVGADESEVDKLVTGGLGSETAVAAEGIKPVVEIGMSRRPPELASLGLMPGVVA